MLIILLAVFGNSLCFLILTKGKRCSNKSTNACFGRHCRSVYTLHGTSRLFSKTGVCTAGIKCCVLQNFPNQSILLRSNFDLDCCVKQWNNLPAFWGLRYGLVGHRLSRIVRKPDYCLCENKGADQPASQ